MSEEEKRSLESKLWGVANVLRGKMNADEYKNYILGFIFYKYLSEKLENYVDEKLLSSEDIKFAEIKEETKQGKEYLEHIQSRCISHLGFFLKPTELFSNLVKKGKNEIKDQPNFIVEDLKNVLNKIERTSAGTDSEDDFKGLFGDVDLTSSKLGNGENKKNETIVEVLSLLNDIDFNLKDPKSDLLGDAYEYLIGQFAAGAGKKGGEFYTPAQVSRLLAQIVTEGKKRVRSVYDPTCGSGSLLLRLKDYAHVDDYYGQELNRTTYNLARMNMILHGVPFDNFKIYQGDTLTDDLHPDLRAEAIVANPPFSADWTGEKDPQLAHDERFSQYGRLAPKSYADYAFITHMLYHLTENGIMATVISLGVLFREGAEEIIRKYLIENKNYLDTVIVLPSNLFYGTPVPACILIFKKCRENPNDILFINATKCFLKQKKQNKLRESDTNEIYSVYSNRREIDNFSRRVSMEEIIKNGYNLNLSRYIPLYEEDKELNIGAACREMRTFNHEMDQINVQIECLCKELKIASPDGANINLLMEFKSAVMQNLFTGKIRFLDKNGNSFHKWQTDIIENVFRPIKGQGLTKEDIWEAGKNKCILYGELYTTYSEIIDEVTSRTDIETKVRSQIGDILIPCSTTTEAIDLARASLIIEPGVLLGGDITILRLKKNGFGAFFAYYLTHFKKFEIARYAQGSTIIHLYYKHFKEVRIDLPGIDEQKKIALFLFLLDTKIKLIKDNLRKTKLFKKALLQQMFV